MDPFLDIWHKVVYAMTDNKIKDTIDEVIAVNVVIRGYMQNLVNGYKEYFVSKWVDKKFHLGHTCTSHFERLHDLLKECIEITNNIMDEHWDVFNKMVASQVKQ